jgi:hypothetical protein
VTDKGFDARVVSFCRASLAVLVLGASISSSCGGEEPKTTTLVVRTMTTPILVGEAPAALAGALVAFDPPGGGARVTRTSDSEGVVQFEGAFHRGRAKVTAFAPEHTLVSKLEVNGTTEVVLQLPRLDLAVAAGSIEVRGAIAGRSGRTTLDVSASLLERLGSVQTRDDGYVLRAPRDRAFLLLGHELRAIDGSAGSESEVVRSFRRDVAASAADVLLDLDLARESALTSERRRFVVRPPAGLEARAYATVESAETELLVAPFLRSVPRSDGGFDVDVGAVDVDVAPEHALTRVVVAALDGARSIRQEPEVLRDGATVEGFLPPPTVADASRSLSDPIPLDSFPSGASLRLEVVAGGKIVWVLETVEEAEAPSVLRLPAPLGISFSADVQLFALSVIARAERLDGIASERAYRRISISRDVPLRRQ